MFFENLDSISELERFSTRLEGVELKEINKLIKMYRTAKDAIKERLLASADNSFTEAKLTQALNTVERALQVLKSRLKPQLQFGFDILHEQGGEDSAKEINAFEKHFNGVVRPVPVEAIVESLNPDNFLFNQYESSVESYSSDLRNSIQNVLGQSLIEQKTWTQAVFDMEQSFNLQEWKLARIVRTELHGIYNTAKLNGFSQINKDYFPDLKKTMYHPMDSRTGEDSIAMSRKEMIVALDEPFVFNYNGKEQRFMRPPNRPNDRAILIPYRSSYDEQ